MFQQGLGEEAVTSSCAGVRCVRVGCGHHVQHCPAALVSVKGARGVLSESGSLAHASVSAALCVTALCCDHPHALKWRE